MSFSVQSWMEWNPYTLLDMWNTCDPGRWFSCPWTLQLLSHFKTTQYKWFTRLLCWLMRILTLWGGRGSIRQGKCAVLGVNVAINFNTFLYKKCKEDWLVGVTGKNNNIHVALTIVFCPTKSRAIYNLLEDQSSFGHYQIFSLRMHDMMEG